MHHSNSIILSSRMISLSYIDKLIHKLEEANTLPIHNVSSIDKELFYSVNIVVGKILSAEKAEKSTKLYFEKIEVGEKAPIDIGTGLQQYYTAEQMLGPVLVVRNLPPKKMMNKLSNGMVLCAASLDDKERELVRPHEKASIGERVCLQGDSLPNSPAAQISFDVMTKYLSSITVGPSNEILFSGIYLM